ncbi:MAG: hypothetical protein A3D28_02340 [Omnitrophica bacterium RIFCSPHIGHO2_02_FULL_63_14]|nr:MAG: hypothetical protein A3D28_02340 [Omnitrophica bacterium RIFCSPHIGHO2_02_FULL_63_14]
MTLPRFARRALWLYPLLGALAGLAYVLLDEGILDERQLPAAGAVLHEFLDAILPVLLGICVGFGVYLFRRESHLNTRLSLKNDRLRQDLLFHALISQILHEIQNPVHNLSAALEDPGGIDSAEKRELIARNLERLRHLKTRYGKLGPELERIDPDEPLAFRPWFERLMDEKLRFQLRAAGVHWTQELEPVRVFVHPMLMEQALLNLFTNAIETLEKLRPEERRLALRAGASADGVEIRMTNEGTFPPEVLEAQGARPVESRRGMGLGLLLLRTIVEQVGGSLKLVNESGHAEVILALPGERAA